MLYNRFFKRSIVVFLLMAFITINTVSLSFADDSYRQISSIRITVSDYLKHYEYDNNDSLPTLSESDFTVPESNQYEIDNVNWYGTNGYSIGTTPYVEISLSAKEKERNNDYYTYYYFGGYYNSSNVHVTGGTFVSATLVSNYNLKIVIALKGFKGTYSAPTSPTWNSAMIGRATWKAPENTSGYYRVDLYKENNKITSVITDQLALSLYPYMTQAGSYYFKVATVPYATAQLSAGKESEAVQSDYLGISAGQVSDGSGQYTDSKYVLNNTNTSASSNPSASGVTAANNTFNAGNYYTVYNSLTGQTTTLSGYGTNNTNAGTATGMTNAGTNTLNNGTTYSVISNNTGAGSNSTTGSWYKEGGYWYFKTASGNRVANDWLIWNNAYYRFDADGKMVTGFYDKDDYATYYLSNSGAMKTGWAQVKGAWYYLNPQPGEYYGLMYKNALVQVGQKSYFFDIEGRMRTGWVIMKDSNGTEQYYFFYPQSSEHPTDYGYMAKGTTVLNGYTLAADGHWVH